MFTLELAIQSVSKKVHQILRGKKTNLWRKEKLRLLYNEMKLLLFAIAIILNQMGSCKLEER